MDPFRWASPLGISVALFLSYSVFCAAIGIGGPIFLRSGHASVNQSLLFNGDLEARFYGKATSDLIREAPAVSEVRRQLMDLWCGFALATALLQVAVVWFGLRKGQTWALWTVTLSDLAIVAYYFVLVLPGVARAGGLRLTDIHPFAWYPAAVIPVAALLGWLGTR
jgi:hypothetical protein